MFSEYTAYGFGAGGGAPFSSNSADSGLHVDPVTGKIYLGGTLLENTIINTGFFNHTIKGEGELFFQFIDANRHSDILIKNNGIELVTQNSFSLNLSSIIMNQTAGVEIIADGTLGIGQINLEQNSINIVIDSVANNIRRILLNSTGCQLSVDTGLSVFKGVFIDNAGNVVCSNIATDQPSANGSGVWKLGKKIAGAVALDAANFVEVMIDGVIVKLGIVV